MSIGICAGKIFRFVSNWQAFTRKKIIIMGISSLALHAVNLLTFIRIKLELYLTFQWCLFVLSFPLINTHAFSFHFHQSTRTHTKLDFLNALRYLVGYRPSADPKQNQLFSWNCWIFTQVRMEVVRFLRFTSATSSNGKQRS